MDFPLRALRLCAKIGFDHISGIFAMQAEQLS
jgi:hypothetical protein